jgi:hypothetical protein
MPEAYSFSVRSPNDWGAVLGSDCAGRFASIDLPIYPASMQSWMMLRANGAASVEPCSPPSTTTAIAIFRAVLSWAKPPNQAFSGPSVEPV